MFTFKFILRITLILVFILWQLYWKVTEKKADSEKPKNKSTTFISRIKKFLFTEVLGTFIVLQLLGLPVLPIKNVPVWIPFLGFLIALIGVCVSVSGRISLGTNWAHTEDYQIKQKHTVTTTGIYKYIRHPIYVGLVLAQVGAELLSQSYLFILFFIVFSFIVYMQARKEEKLLQEHFGKEYTDYMKRSKMLVPYVL